MLEKHRSNILCLNSIRCCFTNDDVVNCLWPSWFVAVMVVAVMVVAVMVMVCGRHGLWPSWLWPSWFVAVMV